MGQLGSGSSSLEALASCAPLPWPDTSQGSPAPPEHAEHSLLLLPIPEHAAGPQGTGKLPGGTMMAVMMVGLVSVVAAVMVMMVATMMVG